MGKKDFLFSIIVPVYNTEKYIEKCLQSIEKAMDVDCEVIIINDGSTDKSEQIISNYIDNLQEKYKNNYIYIKKEHKGLADTKNVGVKKARGKYISVVDSDDYISEDFYDAARKYLEKADIIIYDLYVIFEKDKTLNYIGRAYSDNKREKKVSIINGAMSASSCNKIIKKELYSNYKFPVGKEYEDTAVTPFILEDTDKIKYIPYAMYYYLQREKSIVASNTLVSAFYKICSNISEVIKEKGNDYEKYKNVVNEFFVDRIFEIFIQELDEEKKSFLNSIKDFKEKNVKTIEYIVNTNMTYNLENHYTERQKKLVSNIFEFLLKDKFKSVQNEFTKRKIINYLRNILKGFKIFLKSLANKKA